MGTICMNYKNSETSDPHRLLLNLTDEINLKRIYNYVALLHLSIYYLWKKYKKIIIIKSNNNKFKISAPTWNEEFELADGSYSVSDIQDYFESILKNMEKRIIILQKNYM